MKIITITNAPAIKRDLYDINKFEFLGPEEMDASDGFHTFTELYDHRITLFIALCKTRKYLNYTFPRAQRKSSGAVEILPCDVWRSKFHSDGSTIFGDCAHKEFCNGLPDDSAREWKCCECGKSKDDCWFVLGIGKEKGEQITYHLPLSRWEETNFAETLDRAPEFDGHTPADVLERIKKL